MFRREVPRERGRSGYRGRMTVEIAVMTSALLRPGTGKPGDLGSMATPVIGLSLNPPDDHARINLPGSALGCFQHRGARCWMRCRTHRGRARRMPDRSQRSRRGQSCVVCSIVVHDHRIIGGDVTEDEVCALVEQCGTRRRRIGLPRVVSPITGRPSVRNVTAPSSLPPKKALPQRPALPRKRRTGPAGALVPPGQPG